MKKILVLYLLLNHVSMDVSFAQELNAEQIYAKVNKAIITIYTYDGIGKLLSQGSGIVLNDKGWVITNYHVYAGADKIIVKHKDKILNYTDIIGLDVEKDILILKIADKSFPSISLGNSDLLKVGQKIYAIGSPLGFENTITDGIISGLRSNEERTKSFIQISAAISPGSSGGAVVNSKGQLIAITTFTITKGQNLNFAIPINEAIEVHKKAGIKPNEISAAEYFYKGVIESDRNNHDAAIANYKKAIAINPESANAYYNLGVAYSKKGENEAAITYYKLAITKNPLYSDAYYNLGVVYYKRAEIEMAIIYFKKAIEINPNLASASYNLAVIYAKKKEYDIAITYYKQVVYINPEDADAYYNLGIMYGKKEDDESAITYFKKTIALNPKYAKAYYFLGLMYASKGDTDMKTYYLEKAYILDPSLRRE